LYGRPSGSVIVALFDTVSPAHERKGSEPPWPVSVTGGAVGEKVPLETIVPPVSAATVPPFVAA